MSKANIISINWTNWFKRSIEIGTVLSCLACIVVGGVYWYQQRQLFNTAEKEARQILDRSVETMNSKFQLLKKLGGGIAQDLTQNKLTEKSDIEGRLKEIAQKHPEVFGVGIAYEPYAFSQDQRLYAPYFTENDGGDLIFRPLQEEYDYSNAEWYKKTLQQGERWMEPLFGIAADTRIVDYIVPFYNDPQNTAQENIRGIVYLDYSLERINELVEKLQIGETGYGFVISAEGTVVAHPDEAFLDKDYSIFDIADQYNSQTLRDIGNDILQKDKEYGSYEYIDPLSGKQSLLFFKRIPITGWTLCVNFVEREVIGRESNIVYNYILWMIVCCVVLGMFTSLWATRAWEGNVKNLSLWSLLTSLVLMSGIAIVWYMQIYVRKPESRDATIVSSKIGLQRFLNNIPKDWPQIPVGLYLDYFTFKDLNNINVIGSLWQTFPQEVPEKSHNFYFSNGKFDVRMLHVKRELENNMQLYQWYYNASLYEDFRYSEFPFDYKNVRIPIVLERSYGNHILVPDLDAYTLTTPSSLPGVSDQLELENWQPIESYFSYEKTSPLYYDVTLQDNKDNVYQLYYNFIVRRMFLYYLMSYALPLLVGLLGIFFTLLSIFPPATVSSPPHIKETLAPLGMFISVVFVLVTIHVSLRNVMSGQPIFYLEYFYLLAYALILASLWLSQAVVFGSKHRFIAYKDGIIPKILYWPAWLTGIFVVTVVTFYA